MAFNPNGFGALNSNMMLNQPGRPAPGMGLMALMSATIPPPSMLPPAETTASPLPQTIETSSSSTPARQSGGQPGEQPPTTDQDQQPASGGGAAYPHPNPQPTPQPNNNSSSNDSGRRMSRALLSFMSASTRDISGGSPNLSQQPNNNNNSEEHSNQSTIQLSKNERKLSSARNLFSLMGQSFDHGGGGNNVNGAANTNGSSGIHPQNNNRSFSITTRDLSPKSLRKSSEPLTNQLTTLNNKNNSRRKVVDNEILAATNLNHHQGRKISTGLSPPPPPASHSRAIRSNSDIGWSTMARDVNSSSADLQTQQPAAAHSAVNGKFHQSSVSLAHRLSNPAARDNGLFLSIDDEPCDNQTVSLSPAINECNPTPSAPNLVKADSVLGRRSISAQLSTESVSTFSTRHSITSNQLQNESFPVYSGRQSIASNQILAENEPVPVMKRLQPIVVIEPSTPTVQAPPVSSVGLSYSNESQPQEKYQKPPSPNPGVDVTSFINGEKTYL